MIARSRSSARTALVGAHVGQHQQEFLAAVAAELVDAADVGEHGDGECPQHLVAGRVAIGVVDALEPVEIDQRDRAGRPLRRGAGDLLVQHPHDAAAVERAGQFVEFGELLDPLVGFLQLRARSCRAIAAASWRRCRGTCSARWSGRTPAWWRSARDGCHAASQIGLSVSRNSPARPIAIAVQIIIVCRGVERSELKLNTMNSVQRNSTPTSGAMSGERQRDQHADGRLRRDQIMILEAVVEAGSDSTMRRRDQVRPAGGIGRADRCSGIVPACA